MKGYATINSPFARKVRMAAMETGQPDLGIENVLLADDLARFSL